MTERTRSSRSLWVLPIVAVVAFLMVVPAGTLLAAHGASGASSGATAATSGPAESRLLRELAARGGSSSLLSAPDPSAGLLSAYLASHPSASSLASRFSSFGPSPTGSVGGGPSVAGRLSDGSPSASSAAITPAESAAARLVAEGRIPASAVYLPSANLVHAPSIGPVTPTYNDSPAPMGIADFGLSASGPYSVYTPDVLGSVHLNNYNATGGTLYQDTGGWYWDGTSPTAEVTPWQSGVQLNTVVTNVSYPGSNQGVFWTQNVVDFSGDTLQFVDNIWNFTGPNASLNASTLYSYDGVWVPGDFYYDEGPILPLSFPLTIDLYNNATVVNGRSTIQFGYRVTEGANVFTGVYDSVEFNSLPTVLDPLLTPNYLIDGFEPAFTYGPYQGPLYDAELVFGGPGDGSNAVIDQINGSLNLSYASGLGWSSAPAAYDYGGDTGETAIGVATTWSGSTAYVNQGPSILYGLWNTSGGVPSGWTSLSILNEPGYAFDFVGFNGTSDWNLSYVPSSASGYARMVLPPVAEGYNYTVFADGFDQWNFSLPAVFSGPGDYVLVYADLIGNPSELNAPLYLNGTALAEEAAANVTGWAGQPTMTFANLTLDVNLTFNHLNDWGFAEFDLFWADGVGYPLNVTNLSQGADTDSGLCYDSDLSLPQTCYLSQVPYGYLDLPYYGSQIADWQNSFATFSNLTLWGYFIDGLGLSTGGVVSLWDDYAPTVLGDLSVYDSYGVWAASSPFLYAANDVSGLGAAALTLSDSYAPFVYNVSAYYNAADVLDIGSQYGLFVQLNSTWSSIAFEGQAANGSEILSTTVVEADGIGMNASTEVYVSNLDVYDESQGLFFTNVTNSSIFATNVNDSFGGELVDTWNVTVTSLDVYDDSFGLEFEYGSAATIDDVSASFGSIGGVLEEFGNASVANVYAYEAIGFGVVESWEGTVSVQNVNATFGATGLIVLDSENVDVRNVSAYSDDFFLPATGVSFNGSAFDAATNVSAVDVAFGANVTDGSIVIELTGLNATDEATGAVVQDGSEGITVRDVFANDGAAGVVLFDTEFDSIYNVQVGWYATGTVVFSAEYIWQQWTNAYGPEALGLNAGDVQDLYFTQANVSDESIGLESIDFNHVWSWGLNVTDYAVGTVLVEGNGSWVNDTNVSYWSIGVALGGDFNAHVVGVNASDPYWTPPWYDTVFYGVPISAVVTVDTNNTTVASVDSVGYPLALYDNGSTNLDVQGVNASYGYAAVLLNGTFDGLFAGVSAYEDQYGFVLAPIVTDYYVQPAVYNVLTASSFVNNTYYGVELLQDTFLNLVYDNSFAGNNGATTTYNATHLQAYAANDENWFNDSAGVGNYWADWHTYLNGVLAPYFIANGAWDYHPLGAPEGQYDVTFQESGLASGVSWSVTVGGSTYTTVGSTIVVHEYPGTYAFSVGYPAGYRAGTASGAVVVTNGPQTVSLGFSKLYNVTFSESGLPGATSWAVVLNGVEQSGTASSLVFSEPAGSYAYAVLAPSGFAASPASGSVNVAGDYLVPVSFSSTVPTTYTVTIVESGLVSGTSWSAIFDGVPASTTGTSLTFTVPAGTYAYQVGSVAGYTVSPASGTVPVDGDYTLDVAYTSTAVATVTIAIHASGYSGAWSAYIDGTLVSSSGGTATLGVPADGTYAYQIVPVAGYTASPSSGSVTVGAGGTYTVGVTFSQVTYAVTFGESGLASGASWSVTVGSTTYTSYGTSLTVDLPNGTYSYTYGSVSGYSASGASGSLTVAGTPAGASASYAATSSPSYVGTSMFNTDWAIALGIAAVAIVIALAALLRKPRLPASAPPAAWQGSSSSAKPYDEGAPDQPKGGSGTGAGGPGKN